MPSPLPHLPSNPLGAAPRNPLGRPPAIGSRTGGGRYRVKSPLPRVASRPTNQAPPPAQRQARATPRQQSPARIIHIHQYREARGEPPQQPPPQQPTPEPSAAQQRRESLHSVLRDPDADYVGRMPAEHQERLRVILREHGHEVAQGHARAGLQYLDDVRRRQRGLPPREVPARARYGVNTKRVRQAVKRAAARDAEEQPREPSPEQRAKRQEQLQSMRQIADEMRPDTPESEQ